MGAWDWVKDTWGGVDGGWEAQARAARVAARLNQAPGAHVYVKDGRIIVNRIGKPTSPSPAPKPDRPVVIVREVAPKEGGWGWVGWVVVAAVVIIAGGIVMSQLGYSDDGNESDGMIARADARSAQSFAEGAERLALEHGIALDGNKLEAMILDRMREKRASQTEEEQPGLGYALKHLAVDWFASPDDNADALKSLILDDGEIPHEYLAELADRVDSHALR